MIRNLKGEPESVPCGYCTGCRLDKARDWAVRCIHESQMHDENTYLTLTYANNEIPKYGLSKKHFKNFMKKLRRYGETIHKHNLKFYACGEYGDQFQRPHYHACIFGLEFPDKEFWNFSKTGFKMYRSQALEKLWTKGYSTIGDLTLETAGYCARYIQKKVYGDIDVQADHYNGLLPEFALMSRKPGIGHSWFEKYSNDVFPKDGFHINGRFYKPPRYYDNLYEKKGGDILKIKKIRKTKIKEEDALRVAQRLKHKEISTRNLKRNLTNE